MPGGASTTGTSSRHRGGFGFKTHQVGDQIGKFDRFESVHQSFGHERCLADRALGDGGSGDLHLLAVGQRQVEPGAVSCRTNPVTVVPSVRPTTTGA